MRRVRGLVVAGCLLSAWAAAGEEPARTLPREQRDGVADPPAGPESRAGDPAPPGPQSAATPSPARRAPRAPLTPIASPAPDPTPAPDAAPAPETAPTLEAGPGPETAPVPLTAPARESAPAAPLPSPGDVVHPPLVGRERGAATEVTLDKGSRLAAGLALAGPIGASASVRLLHGLSADVRDDDTRVKAVCGAPIPHCARGFLVQLDGGSGGGKVSLGIGARARVDEEDFHGTVGLGLRASLVRTWGNPIGTEPGLTYLGPEVDLSIVKVDLTLGVLWRVGGRGGASALFSWGVGVGL